MNRTQHDGWVCHTPDNFPLRLMSIRNQLQKRDLSAMKFLCRDIIKANQLESITDASDLFNILWEMDLLDSSKTGLLAEMLYHIERVDLVGHLGCDAKILEKQHSGYHTYFTPYRILLFCLALELTQQDVRQMKLLLYHIIPKGLLEQINDATSLLEQLEKMQMIREENLQMLMELLMRIGRQDLVRMVNGYEIKRLRDTGHLLPGLFIHVQRPVDPFEELRVKGQLPSSIAMHEQRPEQRPNVPLQSMVALQGKPRDHQERPIRGPHIHHPVTGGTAQLDGPTQVYCYNMTQEPRGYCVIINNVKFQALPDREGSNIDKDNLCKTWENLKFKVKSLDNLTGEQIDQALADISQEDHSKFNAFVCCIMSHGDKGVIHGTDDKAINICDLVTKFTSSSCPTLAGKPKLFFFQACRGVDTPEGLNIPSDKACTDAISSQLTQKIPNPADFLLGYATVYGHTAYRLPKEGSLYICALTKMLDQLSYKQPLQLIMSYVNGEIFEIIEKAGPSKECIYQVPDPVCLLTKALYFFEETANQMNFIMKK